jgi:hypothetical protein
MFEIWRARARYSSCVICSPRVSARLRCTLPMSSAAPTSPALPHRATPRSRSRIRATDRSWSRSRPVRTPQMRALVKRRSWWVRPRRPARDQGSCRSVRGRWAPATTSSAPSSSARVQAGRDPLLQRRRQAVLRGLVSARRFAEPRGFGRRDHRLRHLPQFL